VSDQFGLVQALVTDDLAVNILSWGVELGDWIGTFAQHRMGGLNSNVVTYDIELAKNKLRTRFEIEFPKGRYFLDLRECINSGRIKRSYQLTALSTSYLRSYQLTALSTSYLGDLVIRHALSADEWPKAYVGDRACYHKNRNRMVQLPERVVSAVNRRCSLASRLTGISSVAGLQVASYVRDEKLDRWIFHHRLIASREVSDRFVLRIRRNIWEWQNRDIYRQLRYPFWRFSERHHWVPATFQVNGLARLSRGTRISIASEIQLFIVSSQG
jgi:hypothetical protein